MREFVARWGPALAMMAIIFIFSSRSDVPTPPHEGLARLILDSGHAIGYGLLTLTYLHGLRAQGVERVWGVKGTLSLALLLSFLYSLSDEWHQSFVPGRDASWLDILIDLGGSVAAVLLWEAFRNRKQVDSSP
jgi:VanZ family protein